MHPGATLFALGLLASAAALAEPACSPSITDAESIRWMGRPLADLSRQEKDYVFIAVRAAARAADTATVRAKFDLLGIVGSVALERLRGVGFACHFQIKQGSKANGVVLVPADLPFYQCSKVEVVSSCTCERIQITFGLPPQEPGGSAEAYAAQLDLMVLGQHDVSYACGDG